MRDIFEWYSSGRYASEDIAVRLNQGGVRTRLGNPWSDRTVMIVVNNVFYLGKVRHRDHVYPGQHPAIISQELFDTCQEIRQKRIRRPRSESTKLRVYPLSGILRCHLCKNRLHALSIVDYSYYRCRTRRFGAECPGSGKSVRADFMQQEMGKILKGLKPPEGWRVVILEHLQVKGEDVERYQREKGRLEEKLRRVRQMYQEVEVGELEYRKELAATKERLASLNPPEEMRADEVLRAGSYLESLGPAWAAAMPEERKQIYRLILEVVYVDVLEKRLMEVVPKGAFVPLFGEGNLG